MRKDKEMSIDSHRIQVNTITRNPLNKTYEFYIVKWTNGVIYHIRTNHN